VRRLNHCTQVLFDHGGMLARLFGRGEERLVDVEGQCIREGEML
jgi:hypothetical protein